MKTTIGTKVYEATESAMAPGIAKGATQMNDMTTAPTDAPIRLHLPNGLSFPAELQSFESEDGDAFGWVCLDEGQAPEDWTDDVCWAINDAGKPSTQPIGWTTLKESKP
jgi:hypothetical protein